MRRFIELVVRVRQLVAHMPAHMVRSRGRTRLTAGRQVGRKLTQFTFRLAFMIDIAYVGIGALGGTAVARALNPAPSASAPPCRLDTRSRIEAVVQAA